MKDFFNLDGKFFSFMSKVADVMILNLLFIATSLPVITIGASLTALYGVSLKQSEGKDPYIAKTYLKGWKENFSQSTILWLLFLPISLFLIFNIRMETSGAAFLLMRIAMILAVILLAVIMLYLFPLLSKFDNTIKQTITNALLLSLWHFPTTLLLVVITAGFIALTISIFSTVAQISMFWFLFGFALLARIQTHFLAPVFQRHIEDQQPQEESKIEE